MLELLLFLINTLLIELLQNVKGKLYNFEADTLTQHLWLLIDYFIGYFKLSIKNVDYRLKVISFRWIYS